jgi:magnesium transporter
MEIKYNYSGGKLIPGNEETSPVSIFVNPNEDERRHLTQSLKLDEHTLNSALDPDEQARLEFEPEHQALIFKLPVRFPESDPFRFRVASVGAYLFASRLVIVATEDILANQRLRFRETPTIRQILLRLIYIAILSFLEHLRTISMVTDELQNKINVSMENRYLINLFDLQRSLVYYLNSINTNGLLLKRLENSAARIGITQEEKEFLDDIIIENSQCYQQAEIFSNILSNLMDARASIVSNNLNIRIKLLTIVTIGIMVPTFIVSAFSMNVPIPGHNYNWAFYAILGGAAVTAFILFLLERWEKW